MHWVLKVRVPAGAEFDLEDALEAADPPVAREVRKALATRASSEAPFYLPVEGKDPEAALGPLASHLDIVARRKVRETRVWVDDEDEPVVRKRPAPRARRREDED